MGHPNGEETKRNRGGSIPTPAQQIIKLSETINLLTPDQRKEFAKDVLFQMPGWTPLPGPQLEAYQSPADILYFGGAAGGSKSDLLLGLTLTAHRRSIIYRREATQVEALVDRLAEILGTRKGFNGQSLIWRLPDKGKQIEFGSCKDPGNEVKWSGRPHDFIGFDEVPLFSEYQFRFLQTWLRTTIAGQRCRVVCTGNPPQTAEGRWVIGFWGPWLDPKHPKPAKPGELRWYTTVDGKDAERPNGDPFELNGLFVTPISRTFIPSNVDDNPFLIQGTYKAKLEALPEPLRSQMLMGDFRAGVKDPEWQVLPTAWVEAAMARWTPEGKKGQMDSVGVDPARGGDDKFSISTRYGVWYSPLICYPGSEVRDGAEGAGRVIMARRDNAPVHIDIIGYGSSTFDHLKSNGVHVIAIDSAASAPDGQRDRASQTLKFRNMRAYIWWRFRESLHPESGQNIALPPDPELKADLCAPLWMLTPGGILIEPKEDRIGPDGVKISGLKRRLGRSPDKGESVIYCSMATPKRKGTPGVLPPNQPNLAKSYAVNLDFNRRNR